MTNTIKVVTVILAVILAVILFFYFNPFGIKLGYLLSGGGEEATEEVDVDSLLMEYNKQVADYSKYKDSTNPTQLKWAESAKEKANRIAFEYNAILNKEILKQIGD